MPDTGAPWNIPYVENADLVRDWPADSLLVANAVAAGLSAAGNAGIGSNVVSTTKTDTYSASVAVGALSGDITGLTATITPTATASKVLVTVSLAGARSANGTVAATLFRNTGLGAARIANGADSSNRVGASWVVGKADNDTEYGTSTFAFLDSPATTSATTYSVRLSHFANGTLTVYANRSTNNTDVNYAWPVASTITAIEVAA